MVKVLYLGLFVAVICALSVAVPVPLPVPLSGTAAGVHYVHHVHHVIRVNRSAATDAVFADDGTVRSERSTNLSHITGSLRKIQMYVKNWHLQILPDGIVNGTSEDTTDFTILQRTTVNIGQVKIQGVATCLFLCMDSCGLLYATKDFNDECVFNEMIEQHNYNTYSSARYSNQRRTMYLALNRRGQPRKVQIQAQQQLGKLSTYARVLTKWVSMERVDDLLSRIGAQHPLRHHGGHTCTPLFPVTTTPVPDAASGDRLRCRKRKKRKKKRRKCPNDEESCDKKNQPRKTNADAKPNNKKCEVNSPKKICQRLAKSDSLVTNNNNKNKKKKQKQLNPKKKDGNSGKKPMRNNNKKVKKVLAVLSAETESTTTGAILEAEEEYSVSYEAITESAEDSGGITEDEVYEDAGAVSVAPSTQPSAEVD